MGPRDDGKCGLEKLCEEESLVLDPCSAPVVFNGNLAYEVEDYDGDERFSVVLFTHGRYRRASASTCKELEAAGGELPTIKCLQALARWAPAGGPVRMPCFGRRRGHAAGAGMPAGGRIKPLKGHGQPSGKQSIGKDPLARCPLRAAAKARAATNIVEQRKALAGPGLGIWAGPTGAAGEGATEEVGEEEEQEASSQARWGWGRHSWPWPSHYGTGCAAPGRTSSWNWQTACCMAAH